MEKFYAPSLVGANSGLEPANVVAGIEGTVLGARRVGSRVAFADIHVGPPGAAWAVSCLVEVVIKVGAPAIINAAAVTAACRDILRPGNLVRLQGSWCAAHTPGAHGCVDQVCSLVLVARWADARPGCLFRRPKLGEEVPDLRIEQPKITPGRSRTKVGEASKAKPNELDQKKNQQLLPCTPVVAPASPPPHSWVSTLKLCATSRFSTWNLLPHQRSASGSIVHATVPGFEEVCMAEFRDKLDLPATAVSAVPGHVSCNLGNLDVGAAVARLLSLKSVEHLYASLFDGPVSALISAEGNDKSASLGALRSAIQSVAPERWNASLKVWREASRFYREGSEGGKCGDEGASLEDDDGHTGAQTFKVEKQRVGSHPFSSTALAQHAYLAIAKQLGSKWQGVLENQDLTVVVKVKGANLFVGLPLTRRGEVLWKQQAGGVGCDDGVVNESVNFEARQEQDEHQHVGQQQQQLLQHVGQQPLRAWVDTPLRPTVAYGLVQASGPLACGDVLVDPCCGCGTISEVATQEYPGTVFCLSGDSDPTAVACAAHNVRRASMAMKKDATSHDTAAELVDDSHASVESSGRKSKLSSRVNACNVLIDVVQWDSTRLPLRAGVVDRLVTDLPFGKRSGSRSENSDHLYPALFAESARVLRRKTTTTKENCFERRTEKEQSPRSRAVLMSADRGSLKRSLECVASASTAKAMTHTHAKKSAAHSNDRDGLTSKADCEGLRLAKPLEDEAASLCLRAEHHVNMGGLNAAVYVLGEVEPP